MAEPLMWCTPVILPATSALRSVQTTSLFTARATTIRPMSEAIGSAVHAPMDSARASLTIGTSALASDLATASGSEPGVSPGGVHMDGDGVTTMTTITAMATTITITITSASITSTSITIGTTGLCHTSTVMVKITGMEESGPLTGATILI